MVDAGDGELACGLARGMSFPLSSGAGVLSLSHQRRDMGAGPHCYRGGVLLFVRLSASVEGRYEDRATPTADSAEGQRWPKENGWVVDHEAPQGRCSPAR